MFVSGARKNPLLSINYKLKRLQFAKCKSDFQWGRVIWLDETKIKLFGNTHQRWDWRRQKESHTEKTRIRNVKYGGGSWMLWCCFSSKGPGHIVRIHGIMDSIKYQQILNENLTAPSSKLKINTKMVHRPQNKGLAMAITVPRPKPHRKSVGRAGEESPQAESEGSGEILYAGMVSDPAP